jgi:ATP/maltotriose-dependent transcriptional regulator MalT/DNA-binding SARP family transcriptional activator
MPAASVPISKTKIILPRRRTELLSRSRLLDILYERLDRKLIIVSAPAGYGKTSLLIDLAQHSELPFCWLALDPLDRDPQRFVAYLIAALAERFPHFGSRARAALNGLTGFEDGAEPLLVTLVNEMHDDIGEHFVLVLDDFHFLDEAGPVSSFINRFVRLVDENCHLIFSSRTLPELPEIPLLVARDDVGGLDFSDLAFQPDEIQALLAQNQQIELSDEEALKLTAATEGWITGIQFADLKQLRSGESPFRTPHAVGVSVFDFLGQQVLDQQSPDVQAFLLRTSLLEEFDAGLCEAVLAPLYITPQDWSKRLDGIRQKNLFTLPVGSDGQWLRYHHLFRDYLQQRYRKEYPQEVTPLVERLAHVREERGDWPAAYQLYRQLGNANAVADLIERAGGSMYQTAMLTLESWLSDLAPSVVKQRPGLLSLRGAIAYMRGHALDGIRLLDAAIEQLQGQSNQGALALAYLRRGHAYRFLGRYDEATRDAAEALKLAGDQDDLQGLYADGVRLRGLSLYRQGHTLQALDELENALEIQTRLRDDSVIPQLLMETAMAQAALGDYRRAKVAYEKALEIWKRSGNLFYQANLLNNLGFLHYQLGEYEKAAQAFEEGALCAEQCGYKRMEALISISMGDLYSEIEDFEIAGQNYRKAEDLTQPLGDSFLTHYLLVAQGNLALLRREPARARGILDRGAEAIHASESSYEYGHLQLARGRLALQEGNYGQALADLTEAKQCFTEDGREMETIWSSVWLAASQCQIGEVADALETFRSTLQNPNQINYSAVVAARQAGVWLESLRHVREARPVLRGLFEKMDRLDDQLPGIRRQLRRMARTIEVPSPTLTIHAFGRGQVWVNGKLVGAGEWQTQAVRELFFYFLAMNKPVTKEQVGSVLWPDTSEPARLKLRFKNEIYRLRRAVGQNTILYEDEYYQLNPAIDREYDVEAFEAYAARARSSTRREEQISYYQRAIDLVSGRYLVDVDALWVAPEGERLHQVFVSAGLTLADLYLREGHSNRVLEICQRILEQEATSEAAYRLKMHAHSRQGDTAALIRTYRECEDSLRGVFGMPPSAETQELYRKLVS